ncbi:GNAT family N-acetyltransferase [Sporosarcina sp. Sa2YVA2]|uniref:GNAT family N-acetyltransferase n=1 Tax=Sporosarcina quadrami TaxID=2762234 RepID=A0ABR8UE17_9BACL|nr:GNAT family N-acetyltransferase [Sporosarcina quadrami]MBD7986262.1 GNAT family N-acetyltransferase [Sporosarcina quadrami]
MDNVTFNIRKAEIADAAEIAKVHVDSWKTTYDNIVPNEYLASLSYESREQMWTNAIPHGDMYVAENNSGQIVGFAKGGKERSGNYKGYDGELYAIYILQEYQGIGMGKALVKSIIEDLVDIGIHSMLVLVLEDNNSRKFYESLGGRKIDTVAVEIGGKKFSELVYGWKNIEGTCARNIHDNSINLNKNSL